MVVPSPVFVVMVSVCRDVGHIHILSQHVYDGHSTIKGDSFKKDLQPHPALTVQHTTKPRFIFDFVKNSISKAASHLQPQPSLALQETCFFLNVYSRVYGIPPVSVGQLSTDASDLFNNVSQIFLQTPWTNQVGTASN